jgi:hypothetical protein
MMSGTATPITGPPMNTPEPFVLPHEDVVLYALIYTANRMNKHPFAIMYGIAKRPAIQNWLKGDTTSMRYEVMRKLVAKLINEHAIKFSETGFEFPGDRFIHCCGIRPPAVNANPTEL